MYFKNWIQKKEKMCQILLFILSNLFDSALEIQCHTQGQIWAHQCYVKARFVYASNTL